MPEYICRRCGHVAKNKTFLKNHYNRKFPCTNLHNAPCSETCIQELYAGLTHKDSQIAHKCSQMTHNDSQMTHNDSQMTHNDSPADSDTETQFICQYCNKCFTRRNNLTRHIDIWCKHTPSTVNKLISNNKVMVMQMAEKDKLVAEKDKIMTELKKQIEILLDKVGDTTNVNNTNTNTNNVIVLNGFGNEDLSYITGDFVNNLIKAGPYGCIPKLVKRVHFHPKHKENHNIRIPNKSKNIATIYNGKRWLLYGKKEILQDMSDKAYGILQKHYIIGSNQRMENFNNDYENEDMRVIKRIHKDIEFMILNNQ